MRAFILALTIVAASSSIAAAAENEPHVPPASCFAEPQKWSYDRAKEPLALPGEKFLAHMNTCDPVFASSVVESVRHQIQKDETDKFLHQRQFVLAAYGICWAVVALAALGLWLRQRRLARELADLEARIRLAGAESSAGTAT